MSALEAEYDEHYYRALMSADTLPDGPQVLAALLQRPAWHRQAACRGMGTEAFFGGRPPAEQIRGTTDLPTSKAERLDQVAELRRRGMSLRAIGRELGVSGEQVRLDLRRLNVDVEGPTSTTVEPPVPDVCARCPVIRECLAAGTGEQGVWGGLSERHR